MYRPPRRLASALLPVVLLASVLVASSCVTSATNSTDESSPTETAADESLRGFLHQRQYIQRELGLDELRADVSVAVEPSQPSEGKPEIHLLEYLWKSPDKLRIRPRDSTPDRDAALEWAENLRGLANLVVKREMPASHEADEVYRTEQGIVAERDKGDGFVRALADREGRVSRMHYLVPAPGESEHRRQFTFDISSRRVDDKFLADGMTLYLYEGTGDARQKVKKLEVTVAFSEVQTDAGPIKVGTTLTSARADGSTVVYELSNIRVNEEIPERHFSSD